jgi:hypothetical protein
VECRSGDLSQFPLSVCGCFFAAMKVKIPILAAKKRGQDGAHGSFLATKVIYGFTRTLSIYVSMLANGLGVVVQCATCRAMSMALKANDGGELSDTV